MLKNNLKTAVKYLRKHKLFSVINLIGLAIGFCVCLFALLYVQFELSYDNFHKNANHIYRLVTDVKTSTGIDNKSSTATMAPVIQANFPEVKSATRVFLDYLLIQRDNESAVVEENIAYTDSTLFSVFTFPLIKGDFENILSAPNQIILSESAAQKYFGRGNPVGKTLLINGKTEAYVTGVMQDMPGNSHFRVDFLVSLSTLGKGWMSNNSRFFFYTYLLLPENIDIVSFSTKLTNFFQKRRDPNHGEYSLILEPLRSLYLNAKPRGSRAGSSVVGNITNLYIFSSVAVLVLFLACFNFINLTTAFSIQRAKEIGVRKVLGASKSQLVIQFLTDAILLSLIAFFSALLLVYFLLPIFNQLAGKVVATSLFQQLPFVGYLLMAAVVIGVVSGIYPAFFLSAFQTTKSLKGYLSFGKRGVRLRQALVVTQFSISIILIIATLVVYAQLDFMRNHEPGFKKEQRFVIDFHFDQDIVKQGKSLKQQLTAIPGVNFVSLSSSFPGKTNHTFPTKIETANGEVQLLQSDAYFVDYDFIKQHEITVTAGRDFLPDYTTDLRDAMVVNEAMTRRLGYASPDAALGKRFEQLGRTGLIVGVVKDFHFHSFQEKIRPLTFRIAPGFNTYLTLSVSSQKLHGTVSAIKEMWHKLNPGVPVNYFFADDIYNAQYVSEENFGRLFMWLVALAIFISSIGLLGLSAFSIVKRRKEIGIRKVLGASVAGIVGSLTLDFLQPVAVAFLIGSPIAWLAADNWLRDFAYRIDLPWWIFACAGVLTTLFAFLIIAFQAIREAVQNPVESLRTE